MAQIRARTTLPVDLLNEWVVEIDGVRRARFVGNDAPYHAARFANEFRRKTRAENAARQAVISDARD